MKNRSVMFAGTVGIFAWVCALVAIPILAYGAPIVLSYSIVVDTNTQIPGEPAGTTYSQFWVPALDNGNIAFAGCEFSGQSCVNGGQLGIYKYSSGSLSIVVTRDSIMPGATWPGGASRTFQGLSAPVIEGGVVGFWGGDGGAFRVPAWNGVYVSDGGPLNVVADNNTAVPGGTGNFVVAGSPSMSNGQVAFQEAFVFAPGVYMSTGGSLITVADLATTIPGGSGTFTSFSRSVIDSGIVGFTGAGTDESGVYTAENGLLSIVADTGTTIPEVGGVFSIFNEIAFEGGTVVFHGYGGSGLNGIYTTNADSTLDVVAYSSTPIPGSGSNTFRTFGQMSIDNGNVAFQGFGVAGGAQGIYIETGGVLEKVIEVNDILDGKNITGLAMGIDGLSGDQLAFLASFSDGSAGIYTANLEISAVPDGDANGDGQVNVGDLLRAIQILNGQYQNPSQEELDRWDVAPLVNGVPEPNGQNNLGDYTVLQQKVLGIINF